ncbi:hypothetical protein B0T14DRAFT_569868 [Immersiella caudata]|uniref:Uncharacterized protein n=1 Tax=Immersiella caudata TaxID=314043 RepID=A0AA40BUA1_9PEZI|nr:hypothetical protein B0T14DRAFT_569868 [Immersiella caudata]
MQGDNDSAQPARLESDVNPSTQGGKASGPGGIEHNGQPRIFYRYSERKFWINIRDSKEKDQLKPVALGEGTASQKAALESFEEFVRGREPRLPNFPHGVPDTFEFKQYVPFEDNLVELINLLTRNEMENDDLAYWSGASMEEKDMDFGGI